MNSDVLVDENRQRIQTYFPRLAKQLESPSWPSNRLLSEIAPAEKGGWTMAAQARGGAMQIHSRFDPVNEARRWAASNPPRRGALVLLFGWGLGYHAIEWVKAHGANTRAVILFEPEADWFIQSLGYIDLEPLTRAPRIDIVPGDDGQALYQSMLRYMEFILAGEIQLIAAPFAPVYPSSAVHTLRDEVGRILTAKDQMLRHMAEQGARCQRNIIANLRHGLRANLPRDIKNAASDRPAIIVAAGPSLDKTIKYLKEARDRAVIIACDTALAPLLNEGVRPHYVISKDPTERNAAHFEALPSLEGITLAFDPQVDPRIPLLFDDRLVFMPNRNHAIHMHLKGFELGDDDKLPLSTNAAVAAFNLAVTLGCEPVLFTGLDLCFAEEAGASHASGTALLSETKFDSESGQLDYSRGELRDTIQVTTVEGIDGRMHPTLPTFYEALRLLEELIERSGRHCIDATEGGARIAGADVMGMEDALAIYCQQPLPAEAASPEPPQRDKDAFLASMREISEHLRACGKTAEEALELMQQPDLDLKRLQPHCRKIQDGHRLYHELQSGMERFLVEISRDGFFETDPENPKAQFDRYQWFFNEVKEACEAFAPLFDDAANTEE